MKVLSVNIESFHEQFKTNHKDISLEFPSIPNQDKWFHNGVWNELGFLKWKVNKVENIIIKNFLLAILSKIVIKVSNQDSETRYVSKPKPIDTGLVFKLFSNEIESVLPKIKNWILLRFREANFITADLRRDSKQDDNSIDLIITSPPYPNATDYHLYHRFKIFWLGLSRGIR